MKIGLLGGSFNPAHKGHLHIANLALKKLNLDQIWLIPTKQNPFKQKSDYENFASRCKKLQELVKNNPKIKVKAIENYNIYTYNLIKQIKSRNKNQKFIWIMGADNIEKFHLWKNYSKLIKIIEIAIFSRQKFLLKARKSKAFEIYNKFSLKKLPKISLYKTKNYDISSSQIRNNSR